MKIAILANAIAPDVIGGTETQTANLARHLAKEHEVCVYVRGKDCSTEQRDGYLLKRTGSFTTKIPTGRHITSTLLAVKKDKKNIDVTLCMSIEEGFIGVIARNLFGIPTVTWIRGGDWYLKISLLSRIRTKYTLLGTDRVLAQTEGIRLEVENRFPNLKIDVIPNGIDLAGERANGNAVIFVGNLIPRKGVEYLITAMKHVNAPLLIIGDGPERKKLEHMAKGMDVEFAGRQPHEKIRKMLLRGRVFVLPSVRGEGLPNAILEAMSVGLPVIATNIAGIPDIVKEGINGYIVKPAHPSQIFSKILELQDNKLHTKLSINASETVKDYAWPRITQKVESLLHQITVL
ncbi:MAG: glycosyltransferase family 4 protein [archaeon]